MSRRAYFSAAYRDFNQKIRGHNFILEASIEGPVQPDSGMILPIHQLDELIKSVSGRYDHQMINELAEFQAVTPSLERIAQACFINLQSQLQKWTNLTGVRLHKIRLYESDDVWVDVGHRLLPEIER